MLHYVKSFTKNEANNEYKVIICNVILKTIQYFQYIFPNHYIVIPKHHKCIFSKLTHPGLFEYFGSSVEN